MLNIENGAAMEKRMKALEKRIAKLEKAAVLFEEHRQSWIRLNKNLKKLNQEIKRDQRKELAREKRLSIQLVSKRADVDRR